MPALGKVSPFLYSRSMICMSQLRFPGFYTWGIHIIAVDNDLKAATFRMCQWSALPKLIIMTSPVCVDVIFN